MMSYMEVIRNLQNMFLVVGRRVHASFSCSERPAPTDEEGKHAAEISCLHNTSVACT